MKKITFIIITLLLMTCNVSAQNHPDCQKSTVLVQKMWSSWGFWKPNIQLKDYHNQEKSTRIAWNSAVVMNPAYFDLSPKYIKIDGPFDFGTVIPKTQITYVSVPSNKKSVTIYLDKIKGRAKTEVNICVHDKNGLINHKIEFLFPNDNKELQKAWTISNVVGKVIHVTLINHSTTNKFKYKINCK